MTEILIPKLKWCEKSEPSSFGLRTASAPGLRNRQELEIAARDEGSRPEGRSHNGSFLHHLLILTKWRIALVSMVAAAAGALLADPTAGWRILWPLLGTYLLACGAGAWNQIQERDLDARMERTKHRPLPTGALSVRQAGLIVTVLIVAGIALLALTGNVATIVLGVLAVLLYNLLYTPLKRVTPWAPVIGAVVGAFAPAIGWTGVGGAVVAAPLVALIGFFVVWQVPHFWLLFLRVEREYAAAGLPVLTDRLDITRLKRVTYVWIVAATALGLLLPLFGALHNLGLLALLVAMAVWLGFRARGILLTTEPRAEMQAFAAINAYAATLLLAIIVERTVL
jgi:protoheme IX farnesyltransferase